MGRALSIGDRDQLDVIVPSLDLGDAVADPDATTERDLVLARDVRTALWLLNE